MSKTPYAEGWDAGYRDEKVANPYLKGDVDRLSFPAIRWAFEWQLGYARGQLQASADLGDKRREACR